MSKKTLFTLSATILGIGLACTPLKNYRLFNMMMEFLGSGGLFLIMLPSQIIKQTPVVGFYRETGELITATKYKESTFQNFLFGLIWGGVQK